MTSHRLLDRVEAELGELGDSLVSSSGAVTNISPKVRGSTKRSWPPWVKVITTWVCLIIGSLGWARRSWPLMRRWMTSTSPVSRASRRYFPRATGRLDLGALELGDEVLLVRVAADRAGAGDLDGLDALADHLALEAAPDGLDLGQLRHRSASCARPVVAHARLPGVAAPPPARPASSTGPRPGPAARRRPAPMAKKRLAWSGPSSTHLVAGRGVEQPGGQLLEAGLVVLAARAGGRLGDAVAAAGAARASAAASGPASR